MGYYYCQDCDRSEDYGFYCENCETYSDYEEDEYQERECLWCDSKTVYDTDDGNHEECNPREINGLFCSHGCDNGHDYFRGPLVRNSMRGGVIDRVEVEQQSSSPILFMDCQGCGRISAPAPQMSWAAGTPERYSFDAINEAISYGPDPVPGFDRSRCGFCGHRLRGNYDSLIAPFLLILRCLHDECLEQNDSGEVEHRTLWFDFSEPYEHPKSDYLRIHQVGHQDGVWYYQTKCLHCAGWLFFSADFDISSRDKLSYHDVPDRFFPSDYVDWNEDDGWNENYEWDKENVWDGHEGFPHEAHEFQRSTYYIEQLPQHLRQIPEIPPLSDQHDFNKSDFDKRNFSNKDFDKSGGM